MDPRAPVSLEASGPVLVMLAWRAPCVIIYMQAADRAGAAYILPTVFAVKKPLSTLEVHV